MAVRPILSSVVALIFIGIACSSDSTRDPASITLNEATTIVDQAFDSSQRESLVSLCVLGGSELSCQSMWRNLGEWNAVPERYPEIIGTRVLEDQKLDSGNVSRGGFVLELSGMDGLGREYRTDFLIFDEGEGNLVALNPVYWSGVSVGHAPSDGQAVAFPAKTPSTGHTQVDGPVLTSPPPTLGGGFGTDALIQGTLVLDENGECLFLEGENRRYPVVWPDGASWQSDPPAVALKGQLIELGMTVEGGGGYHKHRRIRELAGDRVAAAARGCYGSTGEIAFFNIGSEVKVVAGE